MAKSRRLTPYQRFMARIHAHPQARLLEFLLWGVPGAVLVVIAYVGGRDGWLNDAIALIIAIVGICLIGWGALPPRKVADAKPPPGRKRRELAERRSGKR